MITMSKTDTEILEFPIEGEIGNSNRDHHAIQHEHYTFRT